MIICIGRASSHTQYPKYQMPGHAVTSVAPQATQPQHSKSPRQCIMGIRPMNLLICHCSFFVLGKGKEKRKKEHH